MSQIPDNTSPPHTGEISSVAAGVPPAVEPERPARRISAAPEDVAGELVADDRAAGRRPSTSGKSPDATPTTSGDISRLAEHLFRHEAGKLVSVLTGIFGLDRLQMAEDVVQESLVRALQTWPYYGVPRNPAAWL